MKWITNEASPLLYLDPFSESRLSYISHPDVSTRNKELCPYSSHSSRWSYTDSSAVSWPSYIASEDHYIIALFILYYIVSIVETWGYLVITYSNRVSDNPSLEAVSDFMVGSSCLWSPANIAFFAYWSGIQQEGSVAYAHSSITTISKALPGNESTY